MMTRPNTTNWRAVGSPMTSIIWLRPIRKKAAANVESGLSLAKRFGGVSL